MVIRGGVNLVSHPPAFANDGKRLVVCTGSSVTVFSVATTLPVLQLNGHTDLVTSAQVAPAPGNKASGVNHVWTSSLDGSIRLWDFEVGNLIRTVMVGKPIESMVIPSLLKSVPKGETKGHDNIAVISVRWDKETSLKTSGDSWTGRVLLVNLSTGKLLRGFLAKTLRPQRLIVSPHGNLVGMPDKRKIWVWRVPDGALGHVSAVKSCLLHHTKASKVVAFDPTETVVAGGDKTGRILCWYNVGERTFSARNSSEDNPSLLNDGDVNKGGVRGTDDAQACTTYHWHANAVKSLLYSVDGTYLFSGGAEGTLVIWQPETGKQQFLPRLGGQLCFITSSPDPSLFAISCSDNAIRFVNIGTMNVERSCQGIKPVVPMPNSLKSVNNTRVAFSPEGGKLVLPTDNVALQFYDTVRDCELFEVSIAPRTNISGANSNARNGFTGPSTFVTHVTFSRDGSVMATVDMRLPEGNIGGSACLKFWYFASRKQKFVLNTMVDEPHGAEITALVYHPLEHMIVSCSVDSSFKVWVTGAGIQEDTEKGSAWRCRSVGSYRHKEMYSAAFSPDGSLLGVATEELVTLWNPYTNGFVTSLACVPSPKKITLLAFVHDSKCLVAASAGARPNLIVWHLPTLSVLWSCFVHVEALSVDPKSSHFGIIALAPSAEKGKLQNGDAGSRKATVALFSPFNSTPMAAWSIQQGVGGTLFFASSSLLSSSKVQQDGVMHERDGAQSCLVVLMGSREYVVFNPYRQDDDMKTSFPTPTPLPETAPSAYLTTYGKSSTPSKKESNTDIIGIRAARPWGDLLNASSHVFPSLTRISLTFMESLLEKRNTDVEQQLLLGRESESLAS